LAIDSKLRGCDLVALRIRDICHGNTIQSRAIVIQNKKHLPVQFEITENNIKSVSKLMVTQNLDQNDYLFGSRAKPSDHISTRQYGRIVDNWIVSIGSDKTQYGTHTLRRTNPSLIYKKMKNFRACQLLLGHRKLESAV
tara:strand:- start:486 stop:902 length:417 start_codon:yes stop_codon:yes gene_type:complete